MEKIGGFNEKPEKNVENDKMFGLKISSIDNKLFCGICSVFSNWMENKFPESTTEERFPSWIDVKKELLMGGKYEWIVGGKYKLVSCREGVRNVNNLNREPEMIIIFEAIPAFKKGSEIYRKHKLLKNSSTSKEPDVYAEYLEEGKDFSLRLNEYLEKRLGKKYLFESRIPFGWRSSSGD